MSLFAGCASVRTLSAASCSSNQGKIWVRRCAGGSTEDVWVKYRPIRYEQTYQERNAQCGTPQAGPPRLTSPVLPPDSPGQLSPLPQPARRYAELMPSPAADPRFSVMSSISPASSQTLIGQEACDEANMTPAEFCSRYKDQMAALNVHEGDETAKVVQARRALELQERDIVVGTYKVSLFASLRLNNVQLLTILFRSSYRSAHSISSKIDYGQKMSRNRNGLEIVPETQRQRLASICAVMIHSVRTQVTDTVMGIR